MTQTTVKQVKKGEFITFKYFDDSVEDVPERLVWIRGDYDRSSRKYSCYKFSDVNHERFVKADCKCFTDIFF